MRSRSKACTGIGSALLALASLLAGTAAAQREPVPSELSLEQLLRQSLPVEPRDLEVTTSSRFAQSAAQAPGITYVLSGDEIRLRGLRNLADVLQQLPGLYVTSNGILTFVGARGLGRPADSNGRLLILLDGMRLNENLYDAAPVGEDFPIDIELVDRVEFSPGPGGAVYGNNAFLGVISITTRRAGAGAGLRWTASVDSQRGYRSGLSWAQRSDGGVEWGLAVSAYQRPEMYTPVDEAEFQSARSQQLNWERTRKLLGYGSWRGLRLQLGLNSYNRGTPLLLGSGPQPEMGQATDLNDHGFLQLAYDTGLGDGWDLAARFSAQQMRYRQDSPFVLGTGERGRFRVQALGQWRNLELQLRRQLTHHHRLTAGLELQDDDRQDLVFRALGAEPLQVYQKQGQRMGLFLQDEWQVAGAHLLVLGVRRDGNSSSNSLWVPRLAWVWTASADASLRLMYGGAFRQANLYETMVNTFNFESMPKPERIRTVELGWDARLTAALRYHVSAFDSELRNLISLDGDGFSYINADRVRSRGLELGLEQRWQSGAQLSLALSLQRSLDQSGAQLHNSPRTLVKLNHRQPLSDALSIAWQFYSVSRRSTALDDLPGYAKQNLHLLWRANDGLDVSVGVHNLTATRSYDRTSPFGLAIRQPGRSLHLATEWRLR